MQPPSGTQDLADDPVAVEVLAQRNPVKHGPTDDEVGRPSLAHTVELLELSLPKLQIVGAVGARLSQHGRVRFHPDHASIRDESGKTSGELSRPATCVDDAVCRLRWVAIQEPFVNTAVVLLRLSVGGTLPASSVATTAVIPAPPTLRKRRVDRRLPGPTTGSAMVSHER